MCSCITYAVKHVLHVTSYGLEMVTVIGWCVARCCISGACHRNTSVYSKNHVLSKVRKYVHQTKELSVTTIYRIRFWRRMATFKKAVFYNVTSSIACIHNWREKIIFKLVEKGKWYNIKFGLVVCPYLVYPWTVSKCG